MNEKTLHCYLFGHDGAWQAICVDLDIAVQGTSRMEVQEQLKDMIGVYIEEALKEEPVIAQRLLSRRAPALVRARLFANLIWYRIKSALNGSNGDSASDFTIPCHA